MSTADDMRRHFKEHHDPARIAACSHDSLYWYGSPADEQGWICADCGWSPGEQSDEGYSPQHDRELIRTKVEGILHDLHEAAIIYVSNGCGGDSISDMVAGRCERDGVYDSVSIARFILEIEASEQHAKFWRERAESILEGRDNRNRCACGRLSRCSRGNGDGTWTYLCSDPKCDPRGDVPW